MKLIRNFNELTSDLRGGAISIGNFDGVHRGHARIVEALRAKAAALDGPAIVFTFDPHPVRLLRPDKAPPPLTWTDRKAELLHELGLDALVVYPTDERLLRFSPAAFFDEIVLRQLGARAMIEGPNFFFGKNRAGDIDVLVDLCGAAGVTLEVVQPLLVGGDYVSSSRIRELIRLGDVAQASELLTQPYRIRGMVTHGAARGAQIGFPTANIDAIDTILPAEGVYAGRAVNGAAGNGAECWPAAINIGPNPTFGEHYLKVEVHLIGFSGSLYGKPLEVDFIARVRDTREFASPEDLKEQLYKDVQATLEICKSVRAGESGRVGESSSP